MKYEDLKILDELKEKGSITEEEYQREKAKILNEGRASAHGDRRPLFGLTENTYLMLMHLSQFAGFLLPVAGFVVPILLWTMNREPSTMVDMHGKNIVNFMISYLIYVTLLCIILIGIPLAIVLGLLYVLFVILASVKASNGEYWKYPFTIQFIK